HPGPRRAGPGTRQHRPGRGRAPPGLMAPRPSTRYTADQRRRYAADGPWPGLTVDAMFRRVVARRAEAVAVIDDHRSLTYADLDRWADRVAAALLDLGLEGGDRVALQLPN